MTLNEKAMQYADGKISEILNSAIAQAYADGYEQGYEDRSKEIAVEFPEEEDEDEDDIEYVDLGLPSGTLWAKDYLKNENGFTSMLPYCKASTMKLPTREQADELMNKCLWSVTKYDGRYTYKAFGPNGNTIEFRETGIEKPEGLKDLDDVYIWLANEESEEEPPSLNLYGKDTVSNSYPPLFPGLKLTIRLVK